MELCKTPGENDLLGSRWAMLLLWIVPWVLIIISAYSGNPHTHRRMDLQFLGDGSGMPDQRPPLWTTALLVYGTVVFRGGSRFLAIWAGYPAARFERLELDFLGCSGGEPVGVLCAGKSIG